MLPAAHDFVIKFIVYVAIGQFDCDFQNSVLRRCLFFSPHDSWPTSVVWGLFHVATFRMDTGGFGPFLLKVVVNSFGTKRTSMIRRHWEVMKRPAGFDYSSPR